MAHYMSINNLYKDRRIFDFKEAWALEKIHGTSCRISWKNNQLDLYSGGIKYESFAALFNEEELKQKFIEFGHNEVKLFGEGYGGKIQGMSNTYGPNLKFIVFEVQIGDVWLNVENAHGVANKLGFEFVDYVRISTNIEDIEKEKLKPSTQAIRNGVSSIDENNTIINPREREGIVLRPITEYVDHRGNRVISKHKNESFSETKTKRELSEEDLKVLSDAQQVAEEWVTPMRLEHVLQRFDPDVGMEKTQDIIRAMIEDINKESVGEIIQSKQVNKAIGKLTAKLLKKKLQSSLENTNV